MKFTYKFLSILIGCVAALASAPNAIADDSEVFTNSAFVSTGVRPNVLFIIDTSGSMDTVANSYDPGQDYSSSAICTDPNRVYWTTTNSATPPDCRTSDQWVSVDNNRCQSAANGMKNAGWWNDSYERRCADRTVDEAREAGGGLDGTDRLVDR